MDNGLLSSVEQEENKCVLFCCPQIHKQWLLPLSDHEHAEVWQVSSHPKHCGLEVFLMACQVYEGNDFGGLLADFGPVQASSMTVWFVHHLGTDRRLSINRMQITYEHMVNNE